MTALRGASAYRTPEEKEQHRRELTSLVDKDGATMRFATYNGVSVSPFPGVRRRVADYAANFQARESDVWVCAFVKSGTHWVNEMAHLLMTKSETPPLPKEEFMAERVDRQQLERLPSPRLLNTHLRFGHLPRGVPHTGKVIFVTRDVRDIAVSLYHHVGGRTADNLTLYSTSWSAFLDTFLKGLLQNGNWFDYTKEWHERWLSGQHDNTLVLHYEEMLRDRRAAVQRLAEFLLTSEELHRLPKGFLDSVLQRTDFGAMKAARSSDNTIQMYRKGICGDWRNQFSELEIFEMKAQLFDCLSANDQRLFLHYAGMRDWI